MEGHQSKKEKSSVKIHIPSLSDFADLEEELNKKKTKREPAKTRCGLLDVLPPPKSSVSLVKNNSFVPHVLTKKPVDTAKVGQTKPIVSQVTKPTLPVAQKKQEAPVLVSKPSSSLSSLACYYSDSENEDEEMEEKVEKDELHVNESASSSTSTGMDFFSLSSSSKIPDELLKPISTEEINEMAGISTANNNEMMEDVMPQHPQEPVNQLTSTVMNLPREEIILKNKVELGPKLPVPEQEYHVDPEGNVAFDDKAIEYLCGKRGVKRKQEFSNVDIVEINGEDMKPDEREWLVKALTEEQVVRPVSANAGPGGQSKKKHQITYLAHQAKAMELELKNQWAHNKSARQQCRSKYGF